MEESKYRLLRKEEGDAHFYLEMNDLSEAAVEIWQDQDGEKRTFIRIKMTENEWENLLNEYKQIQVIQETSKRIEI
tara:strand:+ start:693 stop:920 length:228 start_codon:yes stop_codon:yes gene_type:complete